jgi:hypothetical protein
MRLDAAAPLQDGVNTSPPTTSGPASHAPVSVSESLVTVPPAWSELDAVEVALAHALTKAAVAGRFDVVTQLARELEERRLARANFVQIQASGRRAQTDEES